MSIDEAKAKLPLPDLMALLGHGDAAKSKAKSPFREERNPSFGIYESAGKWRWKDHGTGDGGDEIDYLAKAQDLSPERARMAYLEMAGHQRPPQYRLKSASPWQTYRNAADVAFVANLAQWRGISEETIQGLISRNILGAQNGQAAFAVNNGSSAHVRQADGTWRFVPSGTKCDALAFGNPDQDIFAFESQWDAIAVADKLGLDSAYYIATRGASNGALLAPFAKGKKIFAFVQNDKPKGQEKTPAEKWLDDVAKACSAAQILRVQTPLEHKDANDWVRAGAGKTEIRQALRSAVDPMLKAVEVMDYGQLCHYNPEEDGLNLLGNRYVCKGGQLVIIGQSGIGKSSLTVQAAMTWGTGRPFFGIKPERPLRSLYIQAENDMGDMSEIVKGCAHYLAKQIGESAVYDVLRNNIVFVRDTSHTGEDFVRVVRRLVESRGPFDLVFGDPLLSYVGDDLSQQAVASKFLRELLNPLAFEHNFAWVWSHHTGKPSADGKSRKHWNESDFAYVGLGSSELTNWARAIMVLQGTHMTGHYRLLLSKRGKRAGVVDVNNQSCTCIEMKHADKGIHWEPCVIPDEPEEAKKGRGRAPALSDAEMIELRAFAASYTGHNLYQDAMKRFSVKCEKTIKKYLTK